MVARLTTTEACYENAIVMLQKRFGDKTRKEQEYCARFRHLTHVRTLVDTKALRQLYGQVLINIQGL